MGRESTKHGMMNGGTDMASLCQAVSLLCPATALESDKGTKGYL